MFILLYSYINYNEHIETHSNFNTLNVLFEELFIYFVSRQVYKELFISIQFINPVTVHHKCKVREHLGVTRRRIELSINEYYLVYPRGLYKLN